MRKLRKNKVFTAMSGGVDSSVAALLLKQLGYDVTGVFMRCYNLDGCSERDAVDARRVAEKLEIPFYIWDFEEEYKEKVVNYMVEGYRNGITPNPDVMCNKEIKFGLFLQKALETGADYVATGHYVRISAAENSSLTLAPSSTRLRFFGGLKDANDPAGKAARFWGTRERIRLGHLASSKNPVFKLFQAKDKNKDQSYFLWTLTQNQLKHCFFPIGDYLKSEVREMARKVGLPTAEKKDSQGICFLGKVTLDEFLSQYIPLKKGEILNVSGKKIGEHKGAYFYTIGQRHLNAEIRYPKSEIRKDRRPLYVVEKDIETNTLVVAEGSDNPMLYKKEVELTGVNFINVATPSLIRANGGIRVMARVRYRQPLTKAQFIIHNSPHKNQFYTGRAKFIIQFGAPVKFIAPGQSAVFYSQDGEMLGGGVIK